MAEQLIINCNLVREAFDKDIIIISVYSSLCYRFIMGHVPCEQPEAGSTGSKDLWVTEQGKQHP